MQRASYPKSSEPILLQTFKKCLLDDEFWLNDIKSIKMGAKDTKLERYRQILIKHARLKATVQKGSKTTAKIDTSSNILKRSSIVADIADDLAKMKNETIEIPTKTKSTHYLTPTKKSIVPFQNNNNSFHNYQNVQKVQKLNNYGNKPVINQISTFAKSFPNFLKLLSAAKYQVARMLLASDDVEYVVLRARRYALDSIIEYPASHLAYTVASLACFHAGLSYPFCTPSVFNREKLIYEKNPNANVLLADSDKLRYLTSLYFALQASHIFNISTTEGPKIKTSIKTKQNLFSSIIGELNAFVVFREMNEDEKNKRVKTEVKMECDDDDDHDFIEINIKREYFEDAQFKTHLEPKSVKVRKTVFENHQEYKITGNQQVDLKWNLSNLRTSGVKLQPFDNNSVKLFSLPSKLIFASALDQFIQRSNFKNNLPYFNSSEECLPKIIQTMSSYKLTEFLSPEADYLTLVIVCSLKRYEKDIELCLNQKIKVNDNDYRLKLQRLYGIVFHFLIARLSSNMNLVNMIENGQAAELCYKNVISCDENGNFPNNAKDTKTRLLDVIGSFKTHLGEQKVLFEINNKVCIKPTINNQSSKYDLSIPTKMFFKN